jgi:sRNA-binding carbon storage regulator CsrA
MIVKSTDPTDLDRHQLWMRRDDRLHIGDQVVILVADVGGRPGQVSIGVDAPRPMPVHRGEVQQLVERARREGRR